MTSFGENIWQNISQSFIGNDSLEIILLLKTSKDFSIFLPEMSILASVTCVKLAEFKKRVKIFSEIFRKCVKLYFRQWESFCCYQIFSGWALFLRPLPPLRDPCTLELILLWRSYFEGKRVKLMISFQISCFQQNKLPQNVQRYSPCMWSQISKKGHCIVQLSPYIKCKF